MRLLHARRDVPDCDECTAWEENPEEYCRDEVCPACPWGREVREAAIFRLLDWLALQNAGCRLDRHDLTNHEWHMLGIVRSEVGQIELEAREKTKQG